METTVNIQEQLVNDAFSRQSAVFDDIYEHNPITLAMRARVRSEAMKYLTPGAKILELNCGTGIDTLFFARQGYHVLATDNAPGMLQQLNSKIKTQNLEGSVQTARCSFNDFSPLAGSRFDFIFSNFSGLNCTPHLDATLANMGDLLKPGGYAMLVIMPKICPWELVMALRGRWHTAFRRLKKDGTTAHIEGVHFKCYYYNPSFTIKHLGSGFRPISQVGLASVMPPPSLEYFPAKYPRLFSKLQKMDKKMARTFPFNAWCDQYILTMQKK